MNTCCYCNIQLTVADGKTLTSLTKDHLIPKSIHGDFTKARCLKCNRLKANMPLHVFVEFLYGLGKRFKRANGNEYRVIRLQIKNAKELELEISNRLINNEIV